jgi:hypothetical protein
MGEGRQDSPLPRPRRVAKLRGRVLKSRLPSGASVGTQRKRHSPPTARPPHPRRTCKSRADAPRGGLTKLLRWVVQAWWRWLRRRSQRGLSSDAMTRGVAPALPAAAAESRALRVAKPCLEEPDAGNLHVRIRGGPGRATAWGYPTADVGLQRQRIHNSRGLLLLLDRSACYSRGMFRGLGCAMGIFCATHVFACSTRAGDPKANATDSSYPEPADSGSPESATPDVMRSPAPDGTVTADANFATDATEEAAAICSYATDAGRCCTAADCQVYGPFVCDISIHVCVNGVQ